MRPWIHLPVPELLRRSPTEIAASLAAAQMARRLSGEPAQLHAWEAEVALLQRVLSDPLWQGASVALEYDMLRLEKRIDAVLLTQRAIFVLEFKMGAGGVAAGDLAQVEDYAQDLWDFHAASRNHPILPMLVATDAKHLPPLQLGIPIPGVAPVAVANAATLGWKSARRNMPARGWSWMRSAWPGVATWCAAPRAGGAAASPGAAGSR